MTKEEYFSLNMKHAEMAHNIIQQAKKAIAAVGHSINPPCAFRGCTCGAVETFKIESCEFWRQVRAFESELVPTT